MKKKREIKDLKKILVEVQDMETIVEDRLDDLEVDVGKKIDLLEG